MKNILLIIAAAIAFFFASCGGSAEQADNKKAELPFELSGKRRVMMPDFFYKMMSGEIDSTTRFSIEIQRIESSLFGRYSFNGVDSHETFEFHGEIDSLSRVTITGVKDTAGYGPSASSSTLPGIFIGEFTSDTTLEGKWMEKEGGKAARFTCKDYYYEGASLIGLKQKTMSSGKCGKNDDRMECKKVVLLYPEIQRLKDTLAQRKINESILTSVTGDKNKKDLKQAMMQYFADTVNNPTGSAWEEEFYVLHNAYDIVSFQRISTKRFPGPRSVYKHPLYSYSLKDGRRIMLDDIFIPGYKAKLNAVAEEIFRGGKAGSMSDIGWTFPGNKFALNDNFAITENGLLFKFHMNEIAASIVGAPEVLVPYHMIKDLLKKENPLPAHYSKDPVEEIAFH